MPITKEALELAIKAVEESIARIDRGVLLFGSLVAIGVTGETILGVRHWIKDGQLRDLRSIESHMHENETLSLQGKIADANARAKGAEALVASTDAASRDAVAKVATAEARIKEAEARAAEAKLELDGNRSSPFSQRRQGTSRLSWFYLGRSNFARPQSERDSTRQSKQASRRMESYSHTRLVLSWTPADTPTTP